MSKRVTFMERARDKYRGRFKREKREREIEKMVDDGRMVEW